MKTKITITREEAIKLCRHLLGDVGKDGLDEYYVEGEPVETKPDPVEKVAEWIKVTAREWYDNPAHKHELGNIKYLSRQLIAAGLDVTRLK